MTLSDLGNISEFVGAIGVIASLIYVGLEVRRNTKALRAQAQETVVAGYLESINMISEHADVMAKCFRSSYEEFLTYPEGEKTIFFGVIFGFFKHFEQVHAQYRRGLIDEQEWSSWSEHIRMQFHQPGPQWWWAMRRTAFVESFREFLENSSRPEMKPLTEILQDGADR
jgi:hypothetical protein